jgi:hypothetical protein
MFRLTIAALLLLSACTSSPELTKEERAKLDPALSKLFSGINIDEKEYDVFTKPDGLKEYEVIIRVSKPDELQAAGIRLQSNFGPVLTARVTLSELRKILSMSSVQTVQNGSRNYLH